MAHLNYGASSADTSPNRCKSEIITADKVLASADNGKTLIIKELGANKKITLPTLESGYAIKIFNLMNNQTYSLSIQTKLSSNNIFGLISRTSYGGDAATGWDNSPVSYAGSTAATFPGGASPDDYNTVTLAEIIAGTFIELYCDGTYWYLYGIAQSWTAGGDEASITFTDETY